MSNLVDHARRELELLKEDPEWVEGYIKVVQAFADMGHSGGSVDVSIEILNQLFQQNNLTELTDNPDEWEFQANEKYGLSNDEWNNGQGGIWQNIRFSQAFSNDGGKTYFVLHETKDMSNPTRFHTSKPHGKSDD